MKQSHVKGCKIINNPISIVLVNKLIHSSSFYEKSSTCYHAGTAIIKIWSENS